MVYRPDPAKTDPVVLRRRAVEEQIVKATVEQLLARGYLLSVDDGGDTLAIERSTNVEKLMGCLLETDEDRLLARPPADKTNLRAGAVFFVYGNDGHDVICDYSTSLEAHLRPVFDLADRLERGETA